MINLERYDEAEKLVRNAIKLAEELQDDVGIAYGRNSLGLIHLDRKEYIEALGEFETSLELKEALGDKAGQVSTLMNLAQLHKEQNDGKRAIDFLQKALPLAKEIGSIYLDQIEARLG